jgi:hypothetical protein
VEVEVGRPSVWVKAIRADIIEDKTILLDRLNRWVGGGDIRIYL